MTDLMTLKRNISIEKDKIEKIEQNLNLKILEIKKEINNALDFLDKSDADFKKFSENIIERKNEESKLQKQKKELLNDIDSLKENIQRINLTIKDESDKILKLNSETNQLINDLRIKQEEIVKYEKLISDLKQSNKMKSKEKEDITTNALRKINDAQKNITELENEKTKDTQISPILDFLLKEVRIDVPEVEVLSTLAYRKQAIGLNDLKKSLSKTPPVIILKVLRNLDSKGIIKFDERLDTIEIIAKLV